MTIKFTKEQLAAWIEDIKEAAKDDTSFSIAWFKGTENAPLAIIAGWMECFTDNSGVEDLFCCSKSQPKYCMCIKIIVNRGPYAYCDFETLNMPMDINNPEEVDNTCTILEWDINTKALADFFMIEWERLMATLKEEY